MRTRGRWQPKKRISIDSSEGPLTEYALGLKKLQLWSGRGSQDCLCFAPLRLYQAGQLAGARPLRSEAEFGDPFFDVGAIEALATYLQNTHYVFNLPSRFAELGPLKLRYNDVFRGSYEKIDALD